MKKKNPPTDEKTSLPRRIKLTFYMNDHNWYINDIKQPFQMDVAPEIKNGHAYIPIRYISYALKVNPLYVKWDFNNRSANIKDGNNIITLFEGAKNTILKSR